MVESRIIIALLLISVLALGAGWLTMRTLISRREFRDRQAGRGKTQKPLSLEPGE